MKLVTFALALVVCSSVLYNASVAASSAQNAVCSTETCQDDMKRLIKLAKNGSGSAAAIVAMAYASGDGVQQDLIQAERFIRMGARKRDPFAMYLIADWLEHGFVVEKDEQKAAEYLDKAVEKDFAPALFAKAVKLLPSEQPGESETAVKLLQQAAEAKLVDAMYVLARLKQTGAIVEQDLVGAGTLYKSLVLSGYPDAKQQLDAIIVALEQHNSNADVVADFKSVYDIEVIKVVGTRDQSASMLTSIVRKLDSSGLFDRRSTGSRIAGKDCQSIGSNCTTIKQSNASKTTGGALSSH